jgi:hypothetical protein
MRGGIYSDKKDLILRGKKPLTESDVGAAKKK